MGNSRAQTHFFSRSYRWWTESIVSPFEVFSGNTPSQCLPLGFSLPRCCVTPPSCAKATASEFNLGDRQGLIHFKKRFFTSISLSKIFYHISYFITQILVPEWLRSGAPWPATLRSPPPMGGQELLSLELSQASLVVDRWPDMDSPRPCSSETWTNWPEGKTNSSFKPQTNPQKLLKVAIQISRAIRTNISFSPILSAF